MSPDDRLRNRLAKWLPILGGVAVVALASLAADRATRAWYAQAETRPVIDRQAADGRRQVRFEQRALAEVVALRPPVRDESDEPLRTNPVRGSAKLRYQPAALRLLSGAHRGEIVLAQNLLTFSPDMNANLRRGTVAQVTVVSQQGRVKDVRILKPTIRFPLFFKTLAVLFAAAILALGLRGLGFTAALTLTAVASSFILFRSIERGFPPAAAAALYALTVLVALLAVVGVTGRKALAAFLGAGAGLAVAVVVVRVMAGILRLTGLATTHALMLRQALPSERPMDFGSLVICGAVMAILGLVLDLGVSVASSVEQVSLAQEKPDRPAALRAGMRMSRDITGTMLLTLVFVWAGVKIHALLLPHGIGVSLRELLNSEAMSVELLRLMAGGMGLLATGPATALIAPVLLARGPARKQKAVAWTRSRAFIAGIVLAEVALCLVCAVSLVRSRAITRPLGEKRDTGAAFLRRLHGLASADACDDLGLEAFEQGKAALGALAYWKAIDLQPTHYLARRDLARIYAVHHWHYLAWHEVTQALHLMPNDSEAHTIAGTACAWLGRNDEARTHLEEAVRLDPQNAEAADALRILFGDEK